MGAILRGEGVTESERYLADLADRAFLRLWSYPNVFVDRRDGKNSKNRQGKELCDLLVVCGDDVIVFSDKSIEWPTGDLQLAWSRWYRRAVAHSVDQLKGAERWLATFSDRLFLDRECNASFPFALPEEGRRRVHLVAIAVGASKACQEHFAGGMGTLVLDSGIQGDRHFDSRSGAVLPFRLGDVNPGGAYVHVFDPVALDLVLAELDTISDFTRYLTKRASFLRSGTFAGAEGEEDLLGLYLQNIGADHKHDFVRPDGTPWPVGEKVLVSPGHWDWVRRQTGFQAKKAADVPSYAWDQLIELFVEHVLEGTSQGIGGSGVDVSNAEQALRLMAQEDRINRRMLGEAFLESIQIVIARRATRFARRVVAGPTAVNRSLGYVILILAQPDEELPGGYDQYRQVRAQILQAYCFALMEEMPELENVIGIALDAPPEVTGKEGGVRGPRPLASTRLDTRAERRRRSPP